MSFDWGEYLSLAEALCGVAVSGPPIRDEAQYRSSVSRAHYAAFILARNHLKDIDRVPIPRSANAHVFVSRSYEHHPDPRRVQIGMQLRNLRIDRNICDYDDVVVNASHLAIVSLARAARIIADLARL